MPSPDHQPPTSPTLARIDAPGIAQLRAVLEWANRQREDYWRPHVTSDGQMPTLINVLQVHNVVTQFLDVDSIEYAYQLIAQAEAADQRAHVNAQLNGRADHTPGAYAALLEHYRYAKKLLDEYLHRPTGR